MNTETTLRDIIETAVDAAPELAPEQTASAGTITEQAERAERARDEAGRFAKTEAKQAENGKLIQVETDEPAPKVKPPRPSSWRKDYWEKWDQLADQDPQLAEYLGQREQQFAQGVSTYKAEADRAKEFQQVLEPHASRLQAIGANPTQHLDRLLNIDRVLSTGSYDQKVLMLQSIAQNIGLLDGSAQQAPAAGNGYVPPELLQTVGNLQQELGQIKAQHEMQEQATIMREIDEFATTVPYFDDLQEPMAQLLEVGLASNLQDAYRKALAWDEELSAKVAAEQRSERERQETAKQSVARARAAAVSPRSSTPTGAGPASTQGGDTRSIIEAAFNSHLGGGRI